MVLFFMLLASPASNGEFTHGVSNDFVVQPGIELNLVSNRLQRENLGFGCSFFSFYLSLAGVANEILENEPKS